jgi:hypothetical protein
LLGPDGSVPLVVSYDVREKIWNPPMPLLFQRGIGNERRAFTPLGHSEVADQRALRDRAHRRQRRSVDIPGARFSKNLCHGRHS